MKNWVVLIFGVFLVVGACSPGGGGGSDADSGQPTAKWFISKGAPSNSEGVDGDLYLDQDAAILYVKTGGQWVTAAPCLRKFSACDTCSKWPGLMQFRTRHR